MITLKLVLVSIKIHISE